MAQRARKQAGAGALSWSLENASWCHELELEPGAGAWRMLARAVSWMRSELELELMLVR